jgi:hypothetical protein
MRAKNNVGINEQRVRTLLRNHREFWQQLFGGSHLSHLAPGVTMPPWQGLG